MSEICFNSNMTPINISVPNPVQRISQTVIKSIASHLPSYGNQNTETGVGQNSSQGQTAIASLEKFYIRNVILLINLKT